MIRRSSFVGIALVLMLVLGIGPASAAPTVLPMSGPAPRLTFVSRPMAIGFGSTVGPDGFLYVTDTVNGQVLRVDPATGNSAVYAYGLPKLPDGWGDGGAFDVAFVDNQAYVLVSEVDPEATLSGDAINGIYRVDGPNQFAIIADLGTWSKDHLPPTGYFLKTGVQFAFEPYGSGFVVNDAHHNRVLYVTLDGNITQLIQFGDVVPTGLARWGNDIFMAQAGPLTKDSKGNNVEIGQAVQFTVKTLAPLELAGGIPLPVDVEFGPGHLLYALSQGTHVINDGDGSPADPGTGALLRVNPDRTTTTMVGGLNLPTSVTFIGNTAYVVCYTGEIWKIENLTPS